MRGSRRRRRRGLACDSAGNYSEYGTQTTQNYLRGIQTTNSSGEVTFTTIYPGWYQGRATHIHLEVKTNGVSRKITQIAFPESTNTTVYRTGVYASRGSNPTSNLSDGIFADSLSAELVTPSGDPTSAMPPAAKSRFLSRSYPMLGAPASLDGFAAGRVSVAPLG